MKESKCLLDVWEWKRKWYEQTKHLSFSEMSAYLKKQEKEFFRRGVPLQQRSLTRKASGK